MHYAIIAAGEGSRLASEGIQCPKPLVRIAGATLLERLIGIFTRHDAESISVIINSRQPDTHALLEHLRHTTGGIPLNIVVKDTPSSMHSMYALRSHLRNGKFCLTTVDTVFDEKEFSEYINCFEKSNSDGMMAVTEYIDDEKPLYVTTDNNMRITAFLDEAPDNARYISGGIYGLTPKAIDTLEECIAKGKSRMRNFQRELLNDGLLLKAFPMGKIIDIDHAVDIAKAENILSE